MVKKLLHHIRKFSPKSYWKEILAVLIILLAFIFFREQRKELMEIGPMLNRANPFWLLAGLLVTFLYVYFQGMMYKASFKALSLDINLGIAVELFLKRNFLSVFLPAGGISSLAYTSTQLRRRNLNKMQIHQAGALYGFIGLLTVFLVAIPVLFYSFIHNQTLGSAWASLLILGGFLGLIYFLFYSFRKRSWLYKLAERYFPAFANSLENICSANVKKGSLYYTIFYSLMIELCGIIHVYIAMYALDIHHSFEAAVVSYTVSVILMIVSPFLRGLGAVEFSMLYIFQQYGYSNVAGLGITLLYRVFEFWLPLFLGLLAFAWRGKQLVTRLGPALLIFFLGMVNLCSVLTPPFAERMKWEKFYINPQTMYSSKMLIIVLGVALILVSAYLIKGFRSAYWAAITFCFLSIIGHLLKAFDYEEAVLALIILVLLLTSQKEYRVQSSIKWLRIGFGTFITMFIAVCIFSAVGFYFSDYRHFGMEFNLKQSLMQSINCFLFFADTDLEPKTTFAKEFLRICQILGFLCWLIFFYALLVPKKYSLSIQDQDEQSLAKLHVKNHGRSSLDYFKYAIDKELFFSEVADGFTAYRVANHYAVVLEEPVCSLRDKEDLILEFERFCKKRGWAAIYYRVEEDSLMYFQANKKKKLLIGQEAIVDLREFTLEGKEKKSLRNGLNNLQKNGYEAFISLSPQPDEILMEIEAVSNEWLHVFEKKEMGFSQGWFNREDLRQHDLIILRDEEGSAKAFLNIIPDFAYEECTYDLIRKTADAPGAAMDGLIIKLIAYAKEKGYRYLNIGMVALSGLDTADNPAEKIMKFISQKMPNFKVFKSQREYKEKFTKRWENRYLVFDHDIDLFQLPTVIRKIMKPFNGRS